MATEATDDEIDGLWWHKDHEEPARAMVAAAQAIEQSEEHQQRLAMNMACARMVEGAPLPSLYAFGGSFSAAASSLIADEPTMFNVARQVCQAATNQIARDAPKPKATASGGEYSASRRAEEMTRFGLAILKEANAEELFARCFFLSTANDVAGIQVVEDNGRIRLQLVWANEILFNTNESLFSEPRTWYRQRFISKDVLARKFGKGNAERLQAIKDATTVDLSGYGQTSTMVPVYESWHLPAPVEKKKRKTKAEKKTKRKKANESEETADQTDDGAGMHMIALAAGDSTGYEEPGELFKEPWTRERAPIELLVWEPAFAGPFGRSLASQLSGIQISINRLLLKVEKNIRLMAVPRMWTPPGMNTDVLGNQPGEIFKGGTQPPQYVLPQAVGPEVFKYIDDQINRGWATGGLSREAAMGMKPVGLNSAPAQETHLDMVEARQALAKARFENFVCRVFQQIIWLAEDIYDRTGTLEVHDSEALDPIDFGDVRMDPGSYVIGVDAVSGLPQTPSGKLNLIQTLAQIPNFPTAEILSIYQSLDPEREMDLVNAAQNVIDRELEEMLDKGTYTPPEPYFGVDALQAALKRAQTMYAQGRLKKAKQKNLKKLTQWMDDVAALIKQLQKENADMQPAPPPAPPPPGMNAAPLPIPPPGAPAAAPAPTG